MLRHHTPSMQSGTNALTLSVNFVLWQTPRNPKELASVHGVSWTLQCVPPRNLLRYFGLESRAKEFYQSVTSNESYKRPSYASIETPVVQQYGHVSDIFNTSFTSVKRYLSSKQKECVKPLHHHLSNPGSLSSYIWVFSQIWVLTSYRQELKQNRPSVFSTIHI